MRVFIAIDFEKEQKEYFLDIQKKVMGKSVKGNFTDDANFHLTLRFIGEVGSDDINSLILAVEQTAVKMRKFSLQLNHLGFFPKGNRSIVWAGIEKNPGLIKLFNELEKNLSRQGFPKDRKGLSPHVTLGREVLLKERYDDVKESIKLSRENISVNKISLMESKRIGSKLVYSPIFVSEIK